MTCEIAILNMNAVALAADSAMTVRRWVNGREQTRYFKGSNKIFQLSNYHPVGLMIFDSSNLQGVPWEIIVKSFRAYLKETEFPSVLDYGKGLFDFIGRHPKLFAPTRRVELFLAMVDNSARALLAQAANELGLSGDPGGSAGDDRINEYFRTQIDEIRTDELPNIFARDLDATAYVAHKSEIVDRMSRNLEWAYEVGRIHRAWAKLNFELLSELANLTLFRRYADLLQGTGVVIAGYGADDLFPAIVEFRCYGLILDTVATDEKGVQEVGQEVPSLVRPFATTSMVETFLFGVSRDVYGLMWDAFDEFSNSLVEEVKGKLTDDETANINSIRNSLSEKYRDSLAGAVRKGYHSVQEVVASLPIDEMAELAETLVMLESLKEKVTLPTESVGGPIDVAVATRNDGFVWIKRKHYFDAKLNPRFFMREQRNYN